MSRRRAPNNCSPEELDVYVHELLLFIANVLKEGTNFGIEKVSEVVAKRGNLKNLKKIASGDTLQARIHVFLWQHPSIFTVEGNEVFLTKMSPNLDDELEKTKEQRALDYFVFRTQQYGFMQVLISTLFGHLHHASNDIRTYFNNNFLIFFNFLKSYKDVFVFRDNYVVLKHILEISVAEQKILPKSDEYLIDERVAKNTKIVVDVEEGKRIIEYIVTTKTVVAIDCEGVNLGAKSGFITLVQLAYVDCDIFVPDITPYIRIYLFDIRVNRDLLPVCLKRLLQAPFVMKIFQGCSADSTSLYMKHRISLQNVFDTVIAHRYLNNTGKADLYSLYEHYVGEQANRMKKDIKKQYIGNPRLWATRPLTELLIYYAAFDVFSLIRVYFAMIPKLSEEGIQIIAGKSNKASVRAAQRGKGGEDLSGGFPNSRYRNQHYDRQEPNVVWGAKCFNSNSYVNTYGAAKDCLPSSSTDNYVPHFQSRHGYHKQITHRANGFWDPECGSRWNLRRDQHHPNGVYPSVHRRTDHTTDRRRTAEESHKRSFKRKFP